MDIEKEEKQRKEFRNILFELSDSQVALKEKTDRSIIYQRLEHLYYDSQPENCFRHFYSDIFSVLTLIQQENMPGNIDVLGQNLLEIRKGYRAVNFDSEGKLIDISNCIRKLYDHVSLDIARITYSDSADRKTSGEEKITNLQTQILDIQMNVTEAQKAQRQFKKTESKINEVEKKLSNSQKEYIAILGIFSAVVLAFTAGIAFSTSVLNNIAEASIYRTVFISLLIGLVLINVLFGLFYYIGKLVHKRSRIFPLIISNAVFVMCLIITFIFWNCGIVESRNENIQNPHEQIYNQSYDNELSN